MKRNTVSWNETFVSRNKILFPETKILFQETKILFQETKYCFLKQKFCFKKQKFCFKKQKFCFKKRKFCFRKRKFCFRKTMLFLLKLDETKSYSKRWSDRCNDLWWLSSTLNNFCWFEIATLQYVITSKHIWWWQSNKQYKNHSSV